MSEDRNFEFKKKVAKKFQSFVEALDGLSVQDLEKNMLIYSKHKEDTELAQKRDKELQEYKDKVSDLSAPYRDALSALKMKLAFINIIIKEANGEIDDDVELED
jgi:hypothetical protein